MSSNKVYDEYVVKPVRELVNSPKFHEQKIFIFQGQTGIGKSHFQNDEYRTILANAGQKLLLRLTPTTECRDDGVFIDTKPGWFNASHSVPGGEYIGFEVERFKSEVEQLVIVGGMNMCLSISHKALMLAHEPILEFLKKVGLYDKTTIAVEEAHQFIGCGAEGGKIYAEVTGYPSEYYATIPKVLTKFLVRGVHIHGFTATATLHHKGELVENKEHNGLYEIACDLVPRDLLLPHQAWSRSNNPFSLDNSKGIIDPGLIEALRNSIRVKKSREASLMELRNRTGDKHINCKQVGLVVAGQSVKPGQSLKRNSLSPEQLLPLYADVLRNEFGYTSAMQSFITMTESGTFNVNVGRTEHESITEREATRRLNDPDHDAEFMTVKNKGRSGINVHNITTEFIPRIRDPKYIRTETPCQVYGRGVRINTGYGGNFVRTHCQNDLSIFMENAPNKFGIGPGDLIEIVKNSNVLDIWYAESDKTKNVWETALVEFNESYINPCDEGFEWLEQFRTQVHTCPKCQQGLPHTHPLVMSGQSQLVYPASSYQKK